MSTFDRSTPLSAEQLATARADLPDWELGENRLSRTFQFPNFVEAFGFMTRAAIISEKLNHHPEWFNVYGRVDVTCTNHDAGALCEIDIEWCRRIDRLIH